ncbi:DUF3040 domain-containing protein [Kribbella sp. NPDC050459]|uniref:DUF3040 domain-containing protein n=1 Tax=Kribbella sp. NPDC050459 TaxID=3155785 RepID=UPI0033E102C2
MLNDHEQMMLDRIRRQLADEDPKFAAGFEAKARSLPGGPSATSRRRAYAVLIVVVIVLGLMQLIDGEKGGALFMAVIAGGVYMARRFDSRISPPG